jgi:hypothetical protein
MDSPQNELIMKLGLNRELAHRVLFAHRHIQDTPDFHKQIVRDWHGPDPHVLTLAFRGAAKSTIAEESIIVLACLRKFKNCIILGESYDRACERLRSIKHEFESNSFIEELFGTMVGETWQEGKIVIANGVIIQAFGRGQSLRGSKHLSERPDIAFGDDMEDEESISTPEAREKFKQWFLKVVIPAMAPGYRFRIAGTPLDPESFLMKLSHSKNWVTRKFPIKFKDTSGEWVATWPSRFPLVAVEQMEQEFTDAGGSQEFQQEYMCEATDPTTKTFVRDNIKVEPRVRTWEATYACFDPARTVRQRSALTGWAVWSWIANRLVVWDAGGALLRPDEIVSKIFEINNLYEPVHVGVEETGLNEFILQPLRQEQTNRGIAVPIKALNAPKGKLDFIKGLQPFMRSGELTLAKSMPELEQQMLSFPTGKIDTLNALAYALKMKPGNPVYDGFRQDHIVESVDLIRREPHYLAVNATPQYTTAVLCQFIKGSMHVKGDWVCEGDPGTTLSDIIRSASIMASASLRVIAGPVHFGDHDTIGLRGAARKIPVSLDRGGSAVNGRENIRGLIRDMPHGRPALQIGHNARWLLNAFSGGYCHPITKHGTVSEFTDAGPYRVLMEGLESFAALLGTALTEDDSNRNYAYTSTGKKYLSSLVR